MKRNDLIIYGLSVLLILLIPFVVPICYATADDPRYIFLLSGSYTGEPCPDILYMGSFFSHFTSWLYGKWASVEWYSVIYYSLSLYAYVVLAWKILSKNWSVLRYLVLAVFVLFYVYITMVPTNTVLASILGFASLLLMYQANGRKWEYVLGIVTFFLATEMRYAAAFVPYLIACPVFLKGFSFSDKAWWFHRIWLVGLLAVAFLTNWGMKQNYRGEEWETYQQYNRVRGALADNPALGNLSRTFGNEEDNIALDLFSQYRIFDREILTLDKIKRIQTQMKAVNNVSVKQNAKTYVVMYYRLGGWFILLLALWIGVELLIKKEWFSLIQFVATISLFVGANIHMMGTSYAKERVCLYALLSLLFALMVIAYKKVRFFKVLLFSTCLYMGYKHVRKDYYELHESLAERTSLVETEQILARCSAEKVMMTVPTELVPEAFHVSESPIGKKGIIQGWIHFHPKSPKKYQSFKAFTEGFPLLVQKESIEQIAMIQRLIELHYGIKTKQTILDETENLYMIQLDKI